MSVAITPFARQIDMHPILGQMVGKLYAYRGDEQAVAHGATRDLQDLTAEAELILHLSAALIIYFLKKHGAAQLRLATTFGPLRQFNLAHPR